MLSLDKDALELKSKKDFQAPGPGTKTPPGLLHVDPTSLIHHPTVWQDQPPEIYNTRLPPLVLFSINTPHHQQQLQPGC